jgi:Zn-dependent protease
VLVINTGASMEGDAPIDRLLMFAQIGGSLNGMLALFNMLPLPPFDGATVLAGFSRKFHDLIADPRVQNVTMLILLAVFVSGVGGLIARVATNAGVHFAVTVGRLAKPLFALMG